MSSESYSSGLMRVPRTFNWNDPEMAKKEFPEFNAMLRQLLMGKAYVLNERELRAYEPPVLGPPPARNATAATVAVYENKEKEWKVASQKLIEAFHQALNTVRALLPYGSKARTDFDEAADTAPVNDDEEWGARQQFKNGMDTLKRIYSATTATDVDALRRQLYELTDKTDFHDYVAEFNRIVQAIRGAGPGMITDDELKRVAMSGIKNPIVVNSFAINYYMTNPDATYKDIFNQIGIWLQHSAVRKASLVLAV
jgi:hypothetical protein